MEKGHHYTLAPDLTIHRIVNGMWQVAGGHGYIHHESAIEEMMKYHEAGFTSWDLADIYGPAEDFIGEFRRRLSERKGKEELDKIQALTKWVPHPGRIDYPSSKKTYKNHFPEWVLTLLIYFSSTGGIIIIRITWMLSDICQISVMKA